MAIAALPLVPFIRIVQRVGAAAVKIGQLVFAEVGINEVNAQGRFLVAFDNFVRALFAHADVKILHIARFTIDVAEQVERGFTGVHHDGVILLGVELPQISGALGDGCCCTRWQARARLVPQVVHFILGASGALPKLLIGLARASSRSPFTSCASLKLGKS